MAENNNNTRQRQADGKPLTLKSIMVATDFSESSLNALAYSGSLAKALNARLYIIHAFLSPVTPGDMISPEAVSKLSAAHKDRLQKLAESVSKDFGIPAEGIFTTGLAVDRIINEEKRADLIILGMNGAGNAARFGSVATGILNRTRKPVLFIPAKATYTMPSLIVFACDYQREIEQHNLDLLKVLKTTFGTRFLIGNVISKGEEHPDATEMNRKLKAELGVGEKAFAWIEDDDLVHGLEKFYTLHHANLLVFIHHHYSYFSRLFHKSASEAEAFYTHIPLLVMPEEQVAELRNS